MARMSLISVGFVLRIEVRDVDALGRAIARVDQVGPMAQWFSSYLRNSAVVEMPPETIGKAPSSYKLDSKLTEKHHALDSRDLGCDIFAYRFCCGRRAPADRRMAHCRRACQRSDRRLRRRPVGHYLVGEGARKRGFVYSRP